MHEHNAESVWMWWYSRVQCCKDKRCSYIVLFYISNSMVFLRMEIFTCINYYVLHWLSLQENSKEYGQQFEQVRSSKVLHKTKQPLSCFIHKYNLSTCLTASLTHQQSNYKETLHTYIIPLVTFCSTLNLLYNIQLSLAIRQQNILAFYHNQLYYNCDQMSCNLWNCMQGCLAPELSS